MGEQESRTGVVRAALCGLVGVVMGFLLAAQHLPLWGPVETRQQPRPEVAVPAEQTLTETVVVEPERPKPVRRPQSGRPSASTGRKPVPQPAVQKDPFDHNYAMTAHGATVKGGSRPELLNDGQSTAYDGSSGFAYTTWDAKPPQSLVVTLKQPVTLNVVRFLLWDKDSRFYRYRLEASAEMSGDNWSMISDRSLAPTECRGWQVLLFKPCTISRLRLTGTYNSANSGFHVVEFEAYHIPSGLEFPWLEPEF